MKPFVSNKEAVWELGQYCKDFHLQPSQKLKVKNEWAAYQVDTTVFWVVRVIENALREEFNAGGPDHPRMVRRYPDVAEILEPKFRFPPRVVEAPPPAANEVYDEVR